MEAAVGCRAARDRAGKVPKERGALKLATKLTSALSLGLLAVMALYALVQIDNEVILSDADLHRAQRNGLAWRAVIESVWQREGEARARELIESSRRRATTPETTIRILSLAPGAPDRPELSPDEFQALAAGAVVRQIRRDAAGRKWQHAFARLSTGTEPVAVELMEPLQDQQTFIHMSHLAIFGATAAVVLVCGVMATVLLLALVGRPLERLRDKTRRAGAGDFSGPLILRQHDEVGELAADINHMCEQIAEANRRAAAETAARIAALEQLRHSERLATVGQLAAGVAHELGTPLGVVSARAELLVTGRPSPADAAANGRIILEQADRMTAIIQQLLDFSRRREPKMSLANLAQVVTRTLDLIAPVAERGHVTIECATEGPAFARVDQNQLQQVLANLFMNAIQAMPHGGRLRVGLWARRARPPADRSAPERDWLCLSVEDEGTGISRDDLDRLFEPFFTTKGVGEGTGLGLAVVHGIVTEHGGWIEVESDVGKGSRFSIFLPRPAEPAEAAS
jgi:two-component system NtrC family sensor kinase